MKFWPRRRPAPAQPRANATHTAVLEHDLLGIQPEPGSPAALAIALRQTATCLEHDPVDTSTMDDLAPTGQCSRCGKHMVQDDDGYWQIALQP